ncbi:MAG: TolC family protein [Planctomycetota bacterium]
MPRHEPICPVLHTPARRSARSRIVRRALLSWASVALVGCASLDPRADHDRLTELVSTRVGHSVEIAIASPESWDSSQPLSANQSVALALQTSPELQQGLADIAEARAQVVAARLWPDPVLSFALGRPTDGLPGDPHIASLMQQLDWLWTRGPRAAAADADLGSTIATVADAAIRLIAQTRRLHAQVTYGERALAVTERWVEAVGSVRRARASEVAHGTRPRADLRRAEVDEELAREVLVRRRREVEVARRALLARIGRADAAPEFPVVDETDLPTAAALGLDEAAFVSRARRQRCDLAAARARVERHAEARRAVGRSSWIGLGGMVGHERNHEGRTAVTFGAQLQPRLWGSGAVARARADAELARAIANAVGVDRKVCEEVRVAWLRWLEQDELVARIDAGRMALAAGDLSAAEAEGRAGVRSPAEVATVVAAHERVRLERIDAERERVERFHELVRAAGGSWISADSDAPLATAGVTPGADLVATPRPIVPDAIAGNAALARSAPTRADGGDR